MKIYIEPKADCWFSYDFVSTLCLIAKKFKFNVFSLKRLKQLRFQYTDDLCDVMQKFCKIHPKYITAMLLL
jgi:hypothetical protein